jgi:hypothetical protein
MSYMVACCTVRFETRKKRVPQGGTQPHSPKVLWWQACYQVQLSIVRNRSPIQVSIWRILCPDIFCLVGTTRSLWSSALPARGNEEEEEEEEEETLKAWL